MVSRWSAVLFGRCPPKKWRTKELLNCSKLSMDDVGSFLNHSLAAPLWVVGKKQHKISSGGCWRPSVVLNVFRWSSGSFNPSKGSSWGKRNLEGTGHSWTATMNGESVFLTILSKLWSIFLLMAFLNSSISFLISLRRSKFVSSGVLVHLLLLSIPLSPLISVQLSSCCSCYLISWFCWVNSSIVAASDWICRANAVRSWLVVDSILTFELDGTVLYNYVLKSNRPRRRRQTDDARIVNQVWSSRLESSSTSLTLKNEKKNCDAPVWCLPQNLWCQSQKVGEGK